MEKRQLLMLQDALSRFVIMREVKTLGRSEDFNYMESIIALIPDIDYDKAIKEVSDIIYDDTYEYEYDDLDNIIWKYTENKTELYINGSFKRFW